MTKTYETKVFDIGYGNKAFITIVCGSIEHNEKSVKRCNYRAEAERFVEFLTDNTEWEFDKSLINKLNCVVEYAPKTVEVNGVTYVKDGE